MTLLQSQLGKCGSEFLLLLVDYFCYFTEFSLFVSGLAGKKSQRNIALDKFNDVLQVITTKSRVRLW